MQYVKNLKELAEHVTKHRKRVYAIGTFIDDSITTKLILRIHDVEKYLFLPWLWKYWGEKDKETLKNAKKIYTRMNKVGKFITWVVTLPIHGADVAESKKVEKIADVVDRHCDPVANEEFGRDMQKQPLTKFLNEGDAEIAAYLAHKYQAIVGDLATKDRRNEPRTPKSHEEEV